jgi:hypothetical protein
MSTSIFQIPKNTGFTYGAPKVPNITQNAPMMKARNMFNTTINTIKSGTSENIGQYIMYFVSILVVLFGILTFINYFITPIWQLNPGGPGVIPIPGFNDSKVYWTNVNDQNIIPDASSIIGTSTSNWSMSLDIFISQPNINDSRPRIIFTRSNLGAINLRSSLVISESINSYNIAIATIPNTNDLVISTLNSNRNPEDVVIPNVPVQKPFRIGVILFDRMMEVYVNGMLFSTRQFSAPIMPVRGNFMPKPSSNVQRSIGIKNLILWRRAISPSEMRYAKPPLADGSSFDTEQPTSNSCPSLEINTGTIVSSAQRVTTAAASAASSVAAAAAATATAASS